MRPLLLNLSPYKLREWLAVRVYAPRAAHHAALFADAALDFAPGVRMQLLPTDVAHRKIAFTGAYEMGLTRRIVDLAKAGGLLVDVGANFGYFSLLWAGNGGGNRVMAYEASPRNVAALRANVTRNGFGGRITVRDCAVGRENGTARFSLGPEEQTGWGGLGAGQTGELEVRVATLDSELADTPQIDVLKIDIEGADTWALFGARRLFDERRVHHVFFEENTQRMSALGIREGEASGFLRDRGYTVECIADDGGLREYHAHAGQH